MASTVCEACGLIVNRMVRTDGGQRVCSACYRQLTGQASLPPPAPKAQPATTQRVVNASRLNVRAIYMLALMWLCRVGGWVCIGAAIMGLVAILWQENLGIYSLIWLAGGAGLGAMMAAMGELLAEFRKRR